jgi:hypothetical protein
MSGSGYIYFWRKDDAAGNIRICKGSFAGLNVSFAFADCDKSLQKTLRQININRKRECPPPNDGLLVKFDLAVDEGEMVATNVSEGA